MDVFDENTDDTFDQFSKKLAEEAAKEAEAAEQHGSAMRQTMAQTMALTSVLYSKGLIDEKDIEDWNERTQKLSDLLLQLQDGSALEMTGETEGERRDGTIQGLRAAIEMNYMLPSAGADIQKLKDALATLEQRKADAEAGQED